MNEVLTTVFNGLAIAFDKVPFLNKLKGYRSVLGFVALAVLYALDAAGVHGGGWAKAGTPFFTIFTGLALNAKGRE